MQSWEEVGALMWQGDHVKRENHGKCSSWENQVDAMKHWATDRTGEEKQREVIR